MVLIGELRNFRMASKSNTTPRCYSCDEEISGDESQLVVSNNKKYYHIDCWNKMFIETDEVSDEELEAFFVSPIGQQS